MLTEGYGQCEVAANGVQHVMLGTTYHHTVLENCCETACSYSSRINGSKVVLMATEAASSGNQCTSAVSAVLMMYTLKVK